jgi:hypothetical protein
VASSMLGEIASQNGIAVLDGTPSRIPKYGVHIWFINTDLFSCPASLDPVEQIRATPHLPRLEVVRGELDYTVTWHDSSELFDESRHRGVATAVLAGLYHPFSPRDDGVARIHDIEAIIDELAK